MLDHTARLGGGEIALLNLVRTIDRRRFSLVVILFSDGPLREELEKSQIETIVFPLNAGIVDTRKDNLGGGTLLRVLDAFLVLGFIWKLSRELKRQRSDIVHTNSLKADILGGLAGRLAGIPVLWHVRDRIADDYLPSSVARVFRWLARIVPKQVITNSFATLETMKRGGETDTSAMTDAGFCVVHDGTEVLPINSQIPENGKLVVGLVGRISPWKGQHIFLRAIGLIRDRFPDVRFQIIGSALFSEAEYEKEIRALCTSLNLDDVVEFMGFRDDVADLVSKMDLLVHASTTGEPFGQVILEGMAAGKPVVATRGGGVPEFVDDPATGLLVPMGDAKAMADAMARFLRDPVLRRETGAGLGSGSWMDLPWRIPLKKFRRCMSGCWNSLGLTRCQRDRGSE